MSKTDKKINAILTDIENSKLSFKETLYLVYRILDNEFGTPRTQKEIEKRKNGLIKVVNEILEKHFSPLQAVNFIASLGQLLLKRNPELANISREPYIS